jgi:hypothetical protein
MSKHATEAMFESMEENLSDTIASFLDSDSHKLNEAIALVKDPLPVNETELHVRMAKAAMEVYKKAVVSTETN